MGKKEHIFCIRCLAVHKIEMFTIKIENFLKTDKIKIRYFLTVLLNCKTKGNILETPNLKEWAHHNHNCKK